MPFFTVVMDGNRVAVIRGADIQDAATAVGENNDLFGELTLHGRPLVRRRGRTLPKLEVATPSEIALWALSYDQTLADHVLQIDAMRQLVPAIPLVPGLAYADGDNPSYAVTAEDLAVDMRVTN